ncbi:MAG: hypothetical protein NZM29_07400, partial [Nitrospira sp.]|nr:hypothetical protein [Nitrospira sp.]
NQMISLSSLEKATGRSTILRGITEPKPGRSRLRYFGRRRRERKNQAWLSRTTEAGVFRFSSIVDSNLRPDGTGRIETIAQGST